MARMPASAVRLPPMDLIRSFVAVGRRMSITLAADDLCITQPAVSRQMRALEELLGVKLLVRGHRSISLTPEGERLFLAAEEAMRQLQEVVEALGEVRERRPVSVTATIGVSGLWLLPRVGAFQQRYPHIDMRISASSHIVDIRHEGIDLAIRYCSASAAPKGAVRLLGDTLALVAHPSLCATPIDTPERLAAHFLLELDDPIARSVQWARWLEGMGWTGVKPKGILRFDQYDQVIQAAMAGYGIALGRLDLLGPMLRERRLAVLSPPRAALADDYAFWLIQADPEPRRDVQHLAAWIKEEAETDARALDKLFS